MCVPVKHTPRHTRFGGKAEALRSEEERTEWPGPYRRKEVEAEEQSVRSLSFLSLFCPPGFTVKKGNWRRVECFRRRHGTAFRALMKHMLPVDVLLEQTCAQPAVKLDLCTWIDVL